MINLKKILDKIKGKKQEKKEIWPEIPKKELRRIAYIYRLLDLADLNKLSLSLYGYEIENPLFSKIRAQASEETGFYPDSYTFRDIYHFSHIR